MAVQVLTNLFVIVIVYNVTQRERDKREEEKQGQRMMIYVSLSFPAEVGERRDKDTREKFQRSLRTTTQTTNEGFYLGRQIPPFRVLLAHLLLEFYY